MSSKYYDKLIRDNIPEIIIASGNEPVVEVASEDIYIAYLKKKLQEELNEYIKDGNVEELADLLEVIYAIAGLQGCSLYELEEIRIKKKCERGGFEKRLILKQVILE